MLLCVSIRSVHNHLVLAYFVELAITDAYQGIP